jgi:phage baseplate assembly protein W
VADNPAVWGVDFQVSLSDLDLVRSPQAGLSTIAGADNVRGAVLRRLDTPLGDLPAHPEYGCAAWDLLGSPMTATWGDRLLAAVRTALAQEARIAVLGVRVALVREMARADVGITYRLLGEPGERNLVWSLSIERVRASIPA